MFKLNYNIRTTTNGFEDESINGKMAKKQTQMGMTMTVKRVTHYFETEP